MIFGYFLAAMLPATLLLQAYVFRQQLRDKKDTFKNYRHFMHVSMFCQTVAYVGRWTDLAYIQVEEGEEFGEVEARYSGYCKVSGSIQILFETFGYIMLASYLFLLRQSVSHATADLSCLRIKLLGGGLTITFLAWIIILTGPKIDLESTLACGVQYSPDFTEYTELARNW